MHVNLKDALWIAHPVLELSLAGVMYWRRLHRTFPVFFAYIVFQVVNFLVLFPIYQWGSGPNATDRAITAYFDAYWISAAISVVGSKRVMNDGWSPRFIATESEMKNRSNLPRSAIWAPSTTTGQLQLLAAAPS